MFDAVKLTKLKLNITSSALDSIIDYRVKSFQSELKNVYKFRDEHFGRSDVVDLISDVVVFRMNNNFSNLPRHIEIRLHNLIVTLNLR